MAQWGNSDDAANSVLWAVGQLKKDVTAANRNALFGNTTADAYFTGATHGTFGVSEAEVRAARAGGGTKAAHNGLVLRTTGSGGRAGRVTNEVLVAFGGDLTGDYEDTAFVDFFINITTQPSDATANSDANEQVSFTVGVESTPTGSLTYQWEYTADAGNTDSYTNADASGFSGDTGATLTVDANTIGDGTLVRVIVTNGDQSNTSTAATLTVTTA